MRCFGVIFSIVILYLGKALSRSKAVPDDMFGEAIVYELRVRYKSLISDERHIAR